MSLLHGSLRARKWKIPKTRFLAENYLFCLAFWFLILFCHQSFSGQTAAFFNGFGRGVVRGFAGITTIPIAGSITAANQFYVGIYKAPPNPGHGENSSENWEHIVYSKYLDLAFNKEPFEDVDELGSAKKNNPRFKRDLEKFIKAGLIPEKKFDCNEVEVPYTYQFFVTDEPADFIDGFGMGQYNAGKGFIAGCVLAASAPIVDTMDSYSFNLKKQEKDQNEANDEIVAATGIEEYRKDIEVSQLQAVEAATAGFGKGVVRGFVGGVVLTFAGLTYGVISLAKGLFSIKNIPLCYKFTGDCMRDYERLKGDPIQSFVLQKEYGLEEFIVKEEARLEKAAEDLRLGEEKRIAKLIAKDPEYYGEFPDSEELQPKQFKWDRYDYIERITRKRESEAQESGAIEEGEPEDKENA